MSNEYKSNGSNTSSGARSVAPGLGGGLNSAVAASANRFRSAQQVLRSLVIVGLAAGALALSGCSLTSDDGRSVFFHLRSTRHGSLIEGLKQHFRADRTGVGTFEHLGGGVSGKDAVLTLGQFLGPWSFEQLGDTLGHFKGN